MTFAVMKMIFVIAGVTMMIRIAVARIAVAVMIVINFLREKNDDDFRNY